MEGRTSQYQRIGKRYIDRDRDPFFKGLKHPTYIGSVKVQRVAVSSINRWNGNRLSIKHKAYLTNKIPIQDSIDRFLIVVPSVGAPFNFRFVCFH